MFVTITYIRVITYTRRINMAPPNAVTEKYVKNKVKKIIELYAKYNSLYTFCPMTFGYGESGHPDRVLLVGKHFIGIEVKRDENNHHCRPELKAKPNEIMQKRQAKHIREAGGTWVCIHNGNLQELVDLLDKLCKVEYRQFNEADAKALVKLKD